MGSTVMLHQIDCRIQKSNSVKTKAPLVNSCYEIVISVTNLQPIWCSTWANRESMGQLDFYDRRKCLILWRTGRDSNSRPRGS